MQLSRAVVVLVVLFWAGTAAAETVAGEIKSFDPDKRTLVLTNGVTYVLDPAVRIQTVYAGKKGQFTYSAGEKGNLVTKIDE